MNQRTTIKHLGTLPRALRVSFSVFLEPSAPKNTSARTGASSESSGCDALRFVTKHKNKKLHPKYTGS